ncbi:MAG: hypothetical protein LBU34_08640 [Planctomycetaceae bacterium]|nr:hypothetical protein [Planctomycetaceae bacterium]
MKIEISWLSPTQPFGEGLSPNDYLVNLLIKRQSKQPMMRPFRSSLPIPHYQLPYLSG